MTAQRIASLSVLVLCCVQAARSASIPEAVRKNVEARVAEAAPGLEPVYKHFHAHPELSLQEEKTSARLADELEQLGYKVTRRVGGYGVVGVLSNGNGPTVLVRTDMDALPVTEQTGVPYASAVKVTDEKGNTVGVKIGRASCRERV